MQARGKSFGVGDGFGKIGKERGHFRVRFEMALGIAAEQAAGVGKHAVMADAGEDIQQLALLGWACETPLVASSGSFSFRAMSTAA